MATAISQTAKGCTDGKQLSAAWSTANDDKTANKNFYESWGYPCGQAPPKASLEYSWPPKAPTGDPQIEAIWDNYCMMMGFDLYAAALRVSDWYPPTKTEGEKLGEKHGEVNGVKDGDAESDHHGSHS